MKDNSTKKTVVNASSLMDNSPFSPAYISFALPRATNHKL